MELDYAFLADRAERLADGRLFVYGGDVDVISSTGPVAFSCALAARFLVSPDEVDQQHTFALEISKPDGKRDELCPTGTLNTSRNSVDANEPSGAGLVVKMTLGFSVEGKYVIHVIADGKEVKSLPIWWRLRSE